MRSQLARTAKLDTTLLGPLATFTRPGSDQLALEFGQAAKHGEHQSAMSGRGIGPSILERFEAGAALADLIEHVEQVARRAGQPIKPRDHDYVARFCRAGSAICSRAQSDDLRTMCAGSMPISAIRPEPGPSRGGLSPR